LDDGAFYRSSVTHVSSEGFTPTFFGSARAIRDAEKRDPGVARRAVNAAIALSPRSAM